MSGQDSPVADFFSLSDMQRGGALGTLGDRSVTSEESLRQNSGIIAALDALYEAEQRLSEATLAFLHLGRNDLRALHFVMETEHSGSMVTPGMLTSHLQISTASITKLLDRLERDGHITRSIHPEDRRTRVISITPGTREIALRAAKQTFTHRMRVTSRLGPQERKVVQRFLVDMANELHTAHQQ